MSNLPTSQLLGEELTRLHEYTGDLLNLLERERKALISKDIGALKEVTDQKEVACHTLASAQVQFETQSIRERVSQIPEGQRSGLEHQHEQLIALVESCKHLNQVNGKITHRSQQSNLALLKMLSGEANPLYEQHGRSQPNRTRTNSPIVKA